MLFNSFQFLLFFPIVTILYFVIPHKFRWVLLLLASCIFYMAFIPSYILILFTLILTDYIAARYIENSSGVKRKIILTISIVANIGMLGFFKYFNFFNQNLGFIANWFHLTYGPIILHFLLPVGLSFHTFQSLSYTIEVYRGNYKAERHLGIFALYVMFYPQLVAGPIERPEHLIPQFYNKHYPEPSRITSGLRLMLWGFFKKLVIADNLAIIVDAVYNHPRDFHGLNFLVATICFGYQIYCDFSGYTDIARGVARVMGFNLRINFNRPYAATSISDFWHRWHISLSTWFRDYLYIPLGGNRVKLPRWIFIIVTVFLLSGLWHGAAMTFAVWGLLNAIYLIASRLTKKFRNQLWKNLGLATSKLRTVVQIITTFTLVMFGWIFFRANNVSDALYIVKNLFSTGSACTNTTLTKLANSCFLPKELGLDFWHIVALVIGMEIIQYLAVKKGLIPWLDRRPTYIRWLAYSALAWSIVIFGVFASRQFIYFTF